MTDVKKYRKKPVVVEAYQWNGERPLPEPLIGNWDNNPMDNDKVSIKTLEGYLNVLKGDYIIKGLQGEFYPIKEDIFHAMYEAVDNESRV